MRIITSPDIAQEHHSFDVCVIGGGVAGLCAAIAAARNGARTALVHDRPVLGGNASSEVRMWICGAHGRHNKETGILEEIQLENQYRNPSLNYSIWDSVLYGHAHNQPNLSLFLNTACTDGTVTDGHLTEIRCWQLTSQTWVHIAATQYVDCSGDSILAAITGAEHRIGREAREEFGEDIQPTVGDLRTMGNSLLIQAHKTKTPQPFTPPTWAYKFTSPDDFAHRMFGLNGHNFWWIELGGLDDTIRDAEKICSHLHRVVYGVWDYIKNHAPECEKAENWALHWIGSLPGKRENRRYVGDHIITQHDIRDGGRFDDVVCHGGWSMDDHHPAGLHYPGKPTIFHPAPTPYGIPYRAMYSKTVPNILCAGRNISTTHAALSSTRVMGTTAIMGQAAGTAAALCIRHSCSPRDVHAKHLAELQHTLQDDDQWLPGRARAIDPISAQADYHIDGISTADLLRDGHDRDREDEVHHVDLAPGEPLTLSWDSPVDIPGLRLIADSNLDDHKRMPCMYPQPGDINRLSGTLLRDFRVEAQGADGQWTTIADVSDSYKRLIRLPIGATASALRITPLSTWGDKPARLFAAEAVTSGFDKDPTFEPGPRFVTLRDSLPPESLAPPECEITNEAPDPATQRRPGHSA